MKKPKSIKIGPIKYKVEFKTLDSSDMAGINFKHAAIEVDKTMPEQGQKQSLCHEIAHGILRARILENNEVGVESLGDAILDVIQNNPSLGSWLVKKHEKNTD